MNFLEICQRVNTISGMHGSMTDVTSTKDFQENIAQGVKDAWVSIQTYRKDWSFMHRKWDDFYAYQGRAHYPCVGDATEPAVSAFPSDFGSFQREGGLILEYKVLSFKTHDDFHLTDNTVESRPRWFTFNPLNNDLHLELPDDTYNIKIFYQAIPQTLTANADVPALPPAYHNIILYGGVVNFAAFVGNPELYNEYNMKYNIEIGNLVRDFVPFRKIKTRSLV